MSPRAESSPRAVAASLPAALSRLFESVPLGIYLGAFGDGDGADQAVAANPHLKLMFGHAPEADDAAVRPFEPDRFVDPLVRAAFFARLERDGAVTDYLLRLRRADDTPFWAEVTAAVDAAPDGAPRRLSALVRDVSERRRMEDQNRDVSHQVLQAEKLAALGQTVSGVAHELNNPLATILTWSERLAARRLDSVTKRGIETILSESERAAKIVRNLLTFSRKRHTTRTMVDVNQVVRETLALRAYEQRVSNIGTIDGLATGLPRVFADPHHLKQVLLNLVINAEQAMLSAHGRGTLVTRSWLDAERDVVVLELNDDGPGVPDAVQPKIFDPFFTTKAVGKGTGLGLTVAYAIVQDHGGQLRVESAAGGGTSFFVELPAGADGRPAAPRVPAEPVGHGRRGGGPGRRGRTGAGDGRRGGADRRRVPGRPRRRRTRRARPGARDGVRPRRLRPQDAQNGRTRLLSRGREVHAAAGAADRIRDGRRRRHRRRALPGRERMPLARETVPPRRAAPRRPRPDHVGVCPSNPW